MTTPPILSYKGHRYPVEMINTACGSTSGSRSVSVKVEEMMLQRGVVVSYETIQKVVCESHRRVRRLTDLRTPQFA